MRPKKKGHRTTVYINEEMHQKAQELKLNLSDITEKALEEELFKYGGYSTPELELEKTKKEYDIKSLQIEITKIEEMLERKRQDAIASSKPPEVLERERKESIEWNDLTNMIGGDIVEARRNNGGVEDWSAVLAILAKYKAQYPHHTERINKYHQLRAWRDTVVRTPL